MLLPPNPLHLSALRLEARKAEWRERAAMMAENGMDEAGNRISGKRKKGGDGAAGGGKKQRKGAWRPAGVAAGGNAHAWLSQLL